MCSKGHKVWCDLQFVPLIPKGWINTACGEINIPSRGNACRLKHLHPEPCRRIQYLGKILGDTFQFVGSGFSIDFFLLIPILPGNAAPMRT
jgi:hypothetical protein